MPVVQTIQDRCRRCYSCVRHCPSKAIRIEHGQAMVIQERCIGCGRCVKVCSQKAKKVESGIENTLRILKSFPETFAILAPSFPAAFPNVPPLKIVGGVKQLGFKYIIQVAVGADLIAPKYVEYIHNHNNPQVISTPCPAIVNFIEKYHHPLLKYLAPIVSPMIALGRYILTNITPDAKIIFIGPCIAKKKEKIDKNVADVIQEVLTFIELKQLFNIHDIDIENCPETEFDPPIAGLGGIFPVSGGLLRTTRLSNDVLHNDIVVTEGPERVLDILKRLDEGKLDAQLIDLLFCEGCINGPAISNDLSVFVRKDIVADYVQSMFKNKNFSDIKHSTNLSRSFSKEDIEQSMPTEEDIKEIFNLIDKKNPDDELNCGACGYPTCREKAIAVFQRRAEAEMCLPFLIERLEKMNQEMLQAQERIIRSARLASMGEMAAGVAHEINNPLAGVITYLKLMQKKLKLDDINPNEINKFTDYLVLMETETFRVSEIVKSLLEFARPSKPQMMCISVKDVIQKSLLIMNHQVSLQNIIIEEKYDESDLYIKGDFKQLQQVMLNLIINSAQAMSRGGIIKISAQSLNGDSVIEILVEDTGCGIPDENLEKIFNPFFSTKTNKKGTGLGLSTVYSIINKHNGNILVKSKVDQGTQFYIRLPQYHLNEVQNSGSS